MSQAAQKYTNDFLEELKNGNIESGVIVAAYQSTDGEIKLRTFGSFQEKDIRIDSENVIRNSYYVPLAYKLKQKFEELKWVIPENILFIQNLEQKPKNKRKNPIFAKTSKSPKWFPEFLGIDYIITFYEANMEHMSDEQVIVLLYEQLRLITDGDYGVKGFENVLQTVGKDWAETKAQIIDILGDDFSGWSLMKRAGNQVTMFDGNVTYLKTKREVEEEKSELSDQIWD